VVEKRRFSAKSFRARHKGLKFPWYELKNDYNTSKFDILCSRFSVLMARVVEKHRFSAKSSRARHKGLKTLGVI